MQKIVPGNRRYHLLLSKKKFFSHPQTTATFLPSFPFSPCFSLCFSSPLDFSSVAIPLRNKYGNIQPLVFPFGYSPAFLSTIKRHFAPNFFPLFNRKFLFFLFLSFGVSLLHSFFAFVIFFNFGEISIKTQLLSSITVTLEPIPDRKTVAHC